jgi:hypothetical protein
MAFRVAVYPGGERAITEGKLLVEVDKAKVVLPFAVWQSRPEDLILSSPRGAVWVALPDVADLGDVPLWQDSE